MAAALLGVPDAQLDAALDMVITGSGLFGISAITGVVNAANKRKAKGAVAVIAPATESIAQELLKHMPAEDAKVLRQYFTREKQ